MKSTNEHALVVQPKPRFESTQGAALLLEGGGFRGIYTAGILDRFLEEGLHFPYTIGVSMGAIIGMCYVADQPGRMVEWCAKYVPDRRYMSVGNLIREGNFFSHKYGYNQETRRFLPFDFKSFYTAPEHFYFVATDVLTGKPAYFEKSEGEVINLALATSALPLLSRFVTVKGRKYLDGGVYNGLAEEKPLEDGYEKIVAVLTQPRGFRRGPYQENKLANTVYRNYPELVRAFETRNENYNQSLERLEKMEREGKAFLYHVNEDADFSLIQRNPQILWQNYQYGYDQADFRMDELKDFLKS